MSVKINYNKVASKKTHNNVVFFINKKDSLRPVIKLNGDFTKIETPVYGDRVGLFSSLAYNNYSMEEMANGTAWELLNNLV